ncbi:MAG: sugar phosphate isomerase/epimerase [Acidobacteriaceae bacterium]|nr:sugar phosphate isomerase/epimerase [Acidobacteriaceae bacterium]
MPQTFGRRHFIALSAAFARSVSAQNGPEFKFPAEPRERLAVSTYPFRSVISSPQAQDGEPTAGRMSLEQFAGTIRSRLNVAGIEPWSHHFKSTDLAYARHLSASFKSSGVRVVNIPVDLSTKLCGTSEERQAGLATYQSWIDVAVILGSPGIRVHLPHGEQGDQIACSVSALKALAAYGASKNIVVALENDEPETEQPERIAKVIETVNSPFLRALPDFCNAMLVHDDREYDYRAMALLFPLAYHISHVKDEESSDTGKVYTVDVDRIFAIAQKTRYRGFFSMEWEGSGDPYEGSAKLIEASIRNLSR